MCAVRDEDDKPLHFQILHLVLFLHYHYYHHECINVIIVFHLPKLNMFLRHSFHAYMTSLLHKEEEEEKKMSLHFYNSFTRKLSTVEFQCFRIIIRMMDSATNSKFCSQFLP